MVCYRHSVCDESDYKNEFQALRFALAWEFCCSLLTTDVEGADRAASVLGGDLFCAEWHGKDPWDDQCDLHAFDKGSDCWAMSSRVTHSCEENRRLEHQSLCTAQRPVCRPNCMKKAGVDGRKPHHHVRFRFDDEGYPGSTLNGGRHEVVQVNADGCRSQFADCRRNFDVADVPSAVEVVSLVDVQQGHPGEGDEPETKPCLTDRQHDKIDDQAKRAGSDMRGAAPPAVRLKLDALVPAPRCVSTCLDLSVLDRATAGNTLDCLQRRCPDVRGLDGRSRAECEKCFARERIPWQSARTVHIYTDGAHDPASGSAGWACVFLVECDNRMHWLGYISGPCDDEAKLVKGRVANAFIPECVAILRALVAVLEFHGWVCLHCDCLSAIQSCTGLATCNHEAARAAHGFYMTLMLKGKRPHFKHVRSHVGVPFNELADMLAKQAMKDGACMNNHDLLGQAVAQNIAPWLWMTLGELACQQQWPSFDQEKGIFYGTSRCCPRDSHKACQNEIDARNYGAASGPSTDQQSINHCDGKKVTLRLLKYNALTLKSQACQYAMAKLLQREAIDIAGFQETRNVDDDVADEVGAGFAYRKFRAAASNGNFGVQIWLRKAGPWDVAKFAVVHCTHRIICICGKVGNIKTVICAAHAPHSETSESSIDAWWQELRQILARVDGNVATILLLDANARFHVGVDHSRKPANRNADHLEASAIDFSLVFTEHVDCFGRDVYTWRHSRSQKVAKLDYILVPSAWHGSFRTLGALDDAEEIDVAHDHVPLLADVVLQLETGHHPKVAIDRRKLRNPANARLLQQTIAGISQPAWHVDVETHVEHLHKELVRALKETFPVDRDTPRKSYVSEEAFALIKQRHGQRRSLRYARLAEAKHNLNSCFQAWRQACTVAQADVKWSCVDGSRARRFNIAWRECQILRLGLLLKDRLKRDMAAYVESAISDCRRTGPGDFSHFVRCILKLGRKYKAPRTAPVIRKADGNLVADSEDSLEILGRHFAEAEKGVLINPSKRHQT